MFQFPIGVILESFRVPAPEALKKAVSLGADGVQIYASEELLEPTPENRKFRADVVSAARGYGLKIAAVCGDLGYGFHDEATNPAKIETMKRVYEYAQDLGTNIVTTHIGVVPAEKSNPRYAVMQDACGKMAEYAASQGAYFAVETGPEPAAVLRGFLDGIGSRGAAVNLDPANLAMVQGEDAASAVKVLGSYIVHTHAKDGVRRKPCDPEVVYGVKPAEASYSETDYMLEVPLGEGDVAWGPYLRALEECGYRGFLTLEREVGDDPAADLAAGIRFLKNEIRKG